MITVSGSVISVVIRLEIPLVIPVVDYLNEGFFFFEDGTDWLAYEHDPFTKLIVVPHDRVQPQEMIESVLNAILETADSMRQPTNLNAFRDFLCWPQASFPKMLLIHLGMPNSDSPLFRSYLEVLYEYVGDSTGEGKPLWAVGFTNSAQKSILNVTENW